ncbi:MAG: sensor histidine kinase [Vicingaceae bacterium]
MSILTPNISHPSFFDQAKFLLAWRISLVFFSVFLILTPMFSLTSFEAALPSGLALAVGAFSLFYLKKTSNYKPLFWVYAISGTFLVHLAINFVLNFTHFVDFLWITATILLAFIGLGRKYGLLFLGIHAAGIGYFYFFTLNKHIEILQPKSKLLIAGDYLEILLALFSIGYLLTQFLILTEHSEQQQQKSNNELVQKNKENTVLMKEIHHRVKNNLQIITSLLRLQKSDLPLSSQGKFDQAINRIMTMSIIHKKLYQAEELSNIKTDKYLKELIDEILSTQPNSNVIKKEIIITIEDIGLKTIVPLGLLLNELISNSFKHAFNDESTNILKIKISPTSFNQFEFSYLDNGTWIEKDETENKFGTELIGILTDQLDGNYKREGSKYTFNLKNLDI